MLICHGSISDHSVSLPLILMAKATELHCASPERVHSQPEETETCRSSASRVWELLDISVNWRIQTLLSDWKCLSPGGCVVSGICPCQIVVCFLGRKQSVQFPTRSTGCGFGACFHAVGLFSCDVLSFPLASHSGKKGQFDTSLGWKLSATNQVAYKIPVRASIYDLRQKLHLILPPYTENIDFHCL